MEKTTTLEMFNADRDRRRQLAAAVGQSPDSKYLYLAGKGHKTLGVQMALAVERESARIWRRIPRETLRSDVWGSEVNHNNARHQCVQTSEVKATKKKRSG